jgi:hypothetical protein
MNYRFEFFIVEDILCGLLCILWAINFKDRSAGAQRTQRMHEEHKDFNEQSAAAPLRPPRETIFAGTLIVVLSFSFIQTGFANG